MARYLSGSVAAVVFALAWVSRSGVAAAGDAEPAPTTLAANTRERVERDLSRLVEGPELAFCHDPERARKAASPEVCRLTQNSARQRCPAMVRACGGPLQASELEQGASKRRLFALPSIVGSILFWAVLAVLVLVLVRLIVPLLESAVPSPEPLTKDERAPLPPEPVAARTPKDADVERLLAQAESARSEGRFEHAMLTLYAALVHFLGREQLITVEAARTNGDYLRELTPKPELAASVRRAFRTIEGVQFGHRQASAELCAELWSRVLPILKSGVTLAALLFASQALVGCGQGLDLSPEFGPNGHYLLTKLLQANGTRVRRLALASRDVDEDVSQILVLGRDTSAEAWASVLYWADEGGSVIVTDPSQELLKELEVDVEDAVPCARPLDTAPRPLGQELTVVDTGPRYLRRKSNAATNGLRIGASCDGNAHVATFPYGGGSVTLIANSELLGNLSLSVGDNAAFSLDLFGPPSGTLGIVGAWSGGGVSSPILALQNAGLSPLLLEILGFLLVLLWHRGAAFGIRRDPNDSARRAFADHVRALGRSYARARARRHALSQYAGFALESLRARFGRGAPLSLIDLAGEVARRTGERETDVMRLLVEADEAAQEREPERGELGDLETIEKLQALLYPSGGSK